jgi:hypothetical protein
VREPKIKRLAWSEKSLAKEEAVVLPESKTQSNIGVGIGLCLQLPGFALAGQEDATGILGLILIVAAAVPFTWGCVKYAEGKGQSKWAGLVGAASIPGLVVLILLPDRSRHALLPSLQWQKVGGVVSVVAGLALLLLGRWLSSVCQDAQFDKLLDPWRAACTLLGAVFVVIGAILMLVVAVRDR